MVPQRHQHIAFGVIAGAAAFRDVIGDHGEPAEPAIDTVIGGGDEGNPIALLQSQAVDVVAMHQHDHAGTVDAAEAVVVAIDRRVELIVAAQGDQAQHIAAARHCVGISIKLLRRDEIGFAGLGLPFAVPRTERPVKSARLPHPLVDPVENLGIGFGDRGTHQGIIGDPGVPVDLRIWRQCRLCEASDDGRFRQQMLARRRLQAERAVDAGGAVLHRHGLRSARLLIQLDAAETRQEVGDAAVDQMAAVELGGDLYCQPQLAPGRLHAASIGDRPHEIAAEPDKAMHLAFQDLLACLDCVETLVARRLEPELFLQLVDWHQLRFFGDADRALALHV